MNWYEINDVPLNVTANVVSVTAPRLEIVDLTPAVTRVSIFSSSCVAF
jgi:hypothetical protein